MKRFILHTLNQRFSPVGYVLVRKSEFLSVFLSVLGKKKARKAIVFGTTVARLPRPRVGGRTTDWLLGKGAKNSRSSSAVATGSPDVETETARPSNSLPSGLV